ncbi:MAG TPA: phosphopantetheine-binding protein [Ktedonobacteraceae bacterium]|nr:phosphopantetheine-binding protein [Ktedonobacteraceae bacterium]
MLVQIWSNVLGISHVGTHDNFFDLGGHSLLLPQVYSRLREAGIRGFTVVDLFQYPTIKALAERLERKDDQEMPETFALPHRARAALRRDALKKQSGFRQQRKPLPEPETIPE